MVKMDYRTNKEIARDNIVDVTGLEVKRAIQNLYTRTNGDMQAVKAFQKEILIFLETKKAEYTYK